MKKKSIYLVGTLIILIVYGVFITKEKFCFKSTGFAPEISVESKELVLSVKDSQDVLMNGVSAYDEEDGDISSNVLIESISPFNDENKRTVTYAVFDSDSQVSRKTRLLSYSDYTIPKFTLSEPLLPWVGSTEETYIALIKAVSSVDGDITSKVTATQTLGNNNNLLVVNVSDSTGTSSSIELNIENNYNVFSANIQIVLSDYLIYVPIGKEIDPLSYVEDIQANLGSRMELLDEIHVDDNYDASTPGVYEFRLVLNRANGDFGMTKLVVVVEG